MSTINVKDAAGLVVAIEKPLPPGRAGAAGSRPVALCSEDSTALAAIASQATLAAVLAALQAAAPVSLANAHIANGASLSDVVDCASGRLARIDMPASWDAAVLTFQASEDGAQFYDLHKADGAEYAVTAAANQAVLIESADFVSVRYLKVRSGTSGSPVNQTGARTLNIVLTGG